MTYWLRPLLIVALALFAAPRVMAANGETAVICAADGSRQIVLFDFETGAPVEQTVTFETCDHCLMPPMTSGWSTITTPQRADAADRTTGPESPRQAHLTAIAASARGPPAA